MSDITGLMTVTVRVAKGVPLPFTTTRIQWGILNVQEVAGQVLRLGLVGQ